MKQPVGQVYEIQPGTYETPHAFNANCRDVKGRPGKIECIPRDSYVPDNQQSGYVDYVEEPTVESKPFLEQYSDQLFGDV